METVLKLPTGFDIKETTRSYYWVADNGVLHMISKKNAPTINIEETKTMFNAFVQAAHGKRFCILADVTFSTPNDKATREFVAVELPKIVTALAMVSASPLGRMVANLFFSLKTSPYPAKMFSTENEATEWLQQYL
jgi:hypothetical protein